MNGIFVMGPTWLPILLSKTILSCKDFISIVLKFEENFWLCFKLDKNLQLLFWIYLSNIILDFVV
jgi:hypothetical protein